MRWLSGLTIGALLASAGAVAFAIAPVGPAPAASAATVGPISTSFEIDGNKTVGSGVDWDTILDGTPTTSPYVTASGHQSSGIVDASFAYDAGASAANCTGGTDNTVFAGGDKIDDNPWTPEASPEPNAKGDGCTTASAYEIVDVGGTPHIILYQYWTRLQGLGDMTTYQVLAGPNPGSFDDDYLIEFNYQSSGAQTLLRVLDWDGNSWEPLGGSIPYQAAVGTNTDTPATGNDATFGELAIDLTAAGVLGSGTCKTFTADGFITRTGNSQQASTEDIVRDPTPLTISNCGGLVVKKVGTDGGPAASFSYSVARSGGGVVHDTTLVGPAGQQNASGDAVAGTNGLGAAIGLGETHTWANVFAGSDYVLTEAAPPAPWQHQSTVCTVTNPATNQLETYTAPQAFTLYVGATTTCTITNVTSGVKVTKVAEGDPTTFDFAVTGQPGTVPVAGGSSSQVFWYTPGSVVNLVEQPEPGSPQWRLQSISCAPQGGAYQTDVPTATASVQTVAGQVIDCTFTNRQDGAIRIIKNVAGGNGTFEFTTTIPGGPFSITTTGDAKTGMKEYTSLPAGNYSVTETTPAPAYDLTALTCVEDVTGDSVGTLATGTASISLQPGELVTCTYTNTQRGNIIVEKQTNPDGADDEFSFTLTGQPDFTLSDGENRAFNHVVPGAYTLAELALAGWDVTSMTCTGEAAPTTDSPIAFTLDPGETVTCTVLNTATKGSVEVEKHVAGVPEGYDWSFPISISPVPAGQQGTIQATDEDPTVGWTDLDVGVQYTLAEGEVPGWETGTITCTGLVDEDAGAAGFQFTVTPGLTLECDLTNTAEPASVDVTKHVSGVADGTPWSFLISIAPDPDGAGGQPATQAATDADPTVGWTGLAIGTQYTLTEQVPAGWEGGAISCTGIQDESDAPGLQFTATPGAALTCDVTNRAVPASAKVTKTAVGAGGQFTFVLDPVEPDGPAVEQVIVAPPGGGVGETTFANLVPGTEYAISEADPGSGWVAGELVCTVLHAGSQIPAAIDETGFTVAAGDVISCAITNTAKGTIVIVKHVDGADGSFGFTGTWPWNGQPEVGAFDIETTGGTGQAVFADVVAGGYSVTEDLLTSYVGELQQCTETRSGGDADDGSGVDPGDPLTGLIDLDPGETVTCVYSNTELGQIIVDKNIAGGPAAQVFDFEFSDGDTVTPFTLTADQAPWASPLLEPGEYSVEELLEENWELDSVSCVGSEGIEVTDGLATIDLAAGEVVTCTYLNSPEPGDVTLRKIVEGVPQGYPFDFSITIDPVPAGQQATQHVTQADASVSWNDLVVGQTYTLTEGDAPGWNEGAIVCEGLQDADAGAPGFQFTVTPGLSLSCTVTNEAVPGEVTVTKHVEGTPDGFDWSFELVISPADGVLPGASQEVSGTGDGTDTVTWTNLAIGTEYTITEVAPPDGWNEPSLLDCDVADSNPQLPGDQFVATPGLDVSCAITNSVVPPAGEISKELTSISQNEAGTWDLVYEVEVTNLSPIAPLVYDLEDRPFFGIGVVINSSSATGPSDEAADWDAVAGDYVLADDASVAASSTATYVITINATVPAEVYETSQQLCQPGETTPGGFRNTAWLQVGDGQPQPATDCDEPGRTTLDKELVGTPTRITDPADPNVGDWTVVYTVVVANPSDQDLFYDLSDTPGFPEGVVIESAVATNDAGVDTTGWNGESATVLADGEEILAGATHTYTITVIADVTDIVDIDDVTCTATTSGRGFFNEAEMDNGTIVTTDSDCETIPVGRIALSKTVDNSAFDGVDLADLGFGDDLELLGAGDWRLRAALHEGGDPGNPLLHSIAHAGDAGLVFTVPVGGYLLSEQIADAQAAHPLLAYYHATGWVCDDEIADDSVGTVVLGWLTTCSLENVADLVDVGIEKAYDLGDDPDGAVENGDTFDYVLTVTNHGTAPVAELDVTDLIDPELVVAGSAVFTDSAGGPLANWEETGTAGDNDFTAHGVGPFEPGHVVTITIPVTLPAPPPTETPDAVGPDDPAPVVPEIDLEDIPNEACVAITEGEGVPADLIEANDCDDVEVPKKAIDAGVYVRCVNDVPWLYYDIEVSDNVEPGEITVTWTSADGTLTKTETIPWDARTGRLLWPGAAVDENGVPYQFPGWRPVTEADLTNPPVPGTRFLDLILDENVATYPWRDMENPATITFEVNPSQSVLAVYPQALPTCAIDRPPLLEIEKTSSVTSAKPGSSFEYTLQVRSTGIGAAEPVTLIDEIPADLRVDAITTAGAPAFPRWEGCEVTGRGAGGYGGTLRCELLGVLGPNITEAPPVTLDVTLRPTSRATSLTNTGEVCYGNPDVPDDGIVCAESSVRITVPQPLAVTGANAGGLLAAALGVLGLGAILGALAISRRRREQQVTKG
ncbi:DUF5979 domain-containing protein [Agromyces sp. G08B096]|uniref:DUF5979 domain-containing protein n=1 Tax=Agromyces sp. G08B096 TaxID=3156399 RepID=A0AAU7W5T8_9MICO